MRVSLLTGCRPARDRQRQQSRKRQCHWTTVGGLTSNMVRRQRGHTQYSQTHSILSTAYSADGCAVDDSVPPPDGAARSAQAPILRGCEPASQPRQERRNQCEHAGDITQCIPKSPAFSPLSEFSAGTGPLFSTRRVQFFRKKTTQTGRVLPLGFFLEGIKPHNQGKR